MNDCTCRRCLIHDDPGGCLLAGARARALWASLTRRDRVMLRVSYRTLRRHGCRRFEASVAVYGSARDLAGVA